MATINGTSPVFKIRVVEDDGSGTDYVFSHKYKKLRFFTQELYKTAGDNGRARSGKYLKKLIGVIYHYVVDFSEFINDDDAYKVEAVLIAETQNKKLIITPCIDILGWQDEISQEIDGGSAGKKELTPILRNTNNIASEGMILNYVSANYHDSVKWHNPAESQQVFLNKFYQK